jgi:hypothetical protein
MQRIKDNLPTLLIMSSTNFEFAFTFLCTWRFALSKIYCKIPDDIVESLPDRMLELKLKLSVLPETLVICQMDKDARIPDWLLASPFYSITKTAEEQSVVCFQIHVPEGIKGDEGWRGLKVEGPLDFSAIGVLASLTMPLAKEGISVFAMSTYNTDYLLVKEQHLKKAVEILSREGHQIREDSSEFGVQSSE